MKSFKHILQLLSNYKAYVVLNLIFNAIAIVFSLVSLTMVGPFLGILFDKIEIVKTAPELAFNVESVVQYFNYKLANVIDQSGKTKGLLFICLLVAVVFAVKNIFRYLALFIMAPIRNGVIKDLRNKIYKRILSLPLSYFSEKRKGDLLTRNSVDVVEVEWGVLGTLEAFFKEPLTIVLYLIALFYISPKLTLTVLLVLPLTGLLIGYIGKSLKRASLRAQDKQSDLLSILEESIGGLRIIKSFNSEKKLGGKFEDKNVEHKNMMNAVLRRKDMASPLTEILAIMVVVFVLYFGGRMVLGGDAQLSAESFITFMLIFSQIISPAKAFTASYYRIVKGMASMERIEEIIDEPIKIKEAANAIDLREFSDSIEYKNLSYAYDDQLDKRVLKDVNCKIHKGSTVALVGPSGAGKSTFVDLIPRFFDPKEGSVFIDGIDLKAVKLSSLRDKVAVVSQEAILFNDSIANNISMGLENATQSQIEEAAKMANAHDFISKMDRGYQSNIGDRGNKLSGGEKQRITIARAILKNAPILILDEATSSLDAESERLVQDALSKLMQNRTSIVIAHRLSTIQHADEIWVMQNGRIVEQGNHHSLIQSDSLYKKLAALQGL